MKKTFPTLCLILSTTLGSASFAETATQAELEACAALRDPLDSLSCFERLTDRGRAKIVETPTVVQPAPVQQPEVTAPAVTAPSAPNVAPAAKPQVAEQPRKAPVKESVGRVVTIDDSVGEEHLAKQKEEQGPTKFTATIVKVEKKGRGILVFHMENGQVWRQVESRFFAYPKNRSFEVVIDQGMLGDYRMRVEGKGRQTRIRRMK